MNAPHIKLNTTPQIIYTRIADDTHPVFASVSAAACYGVADGPRVSPGIPEDTSIKTQVPAPQGVTPGMSEKARKRA
jgi:hypothetical protein